MRSAVGRQPAEHSPVAAELSVVARRAAALEEVRETVRREWANTRRLEANRVFYESLLKRYNVTIEPALVEAAEAKGAGHEARP